MDEKDKFKRDTSSLQRSYNQMGRKFKRDSHTSIEPNENISSSSAGDEKTGNEPLDTASFIALYLITYLISMAILGIFNYFKPIDYWLFVPYFALLLLLFFSNENVSIFGGIIFSMAILGIFNYFKPIDYWLFVPYGVVLMASLTVGPETQNK